MDYFLFEAPGGFCSYYASAMVVMLRAEGVPARVVAGYAMGTYDFQRAAYGVAGAAAHAWVEVYFPAYGWVEFEPTASRGAFLRSAGLAFALTPAAPLPAASANALGPWGLVLAGRILLLLAGIVRAYRAREPGWNTPRGRARALYRQVCNALAWAGVVAADNLTPNEYLAATEAVLRQHPALTLALVEITRLYLRATFSAQAPDLAALRRGRQVWRRAWSDWCRLWWRARRAKG